MVLVFSGCDGSSAGSVEAESSSSEFVDPGSGPDTTAADPETADDPLRRGTYALDFSIDYVDINEGQDEELRVALGVSRRDGHDRRIVLVVEPESDRDALNILAELDHEALEGGRLYTTWRVRLEVGAAPLRRHERRFTVIADDGLQQLSRTITLGVNPVSAPDVYLLIGQSNMEGSSEPGAREESGLDSMHPRIRQLNVKQNNREIFSTDETFTNEAFNVIQPRFVGAEDPLHEPRFPQQPGKGGTFIGPGLSFAKAALKATTQDVILVPAAWSGRGFCANDDAELAWNALPTDEPALGGTLLTERALTRLNMTLRDSGGIFRGILWHQGEADANSAPCAERYEENLIALAQRIRSDAVLDTRGSSARGADAAVPFVAGTMSRGNDERGVFSTYGPDKQRVDNAHRNLPNRLRWSATVIADDLVPPAYPCGQGSCIHFGAAAYRELGTRYYEALQRALSNP